MLPAMSSGTGPELQVLTSKEHEFRFVRNYRDIFKNTSSINPQKLHNDHLQI
jgi:hypothetical protein